MIGQLYIDNIDIRATYGLYATEQGYNELIQWPSLKAVIYNDWHEEDGIEPDLSNPTLQSKSCRLSLNGITSADKVDQLVDMLTSRVYHNIDAIEIGYRCTMRYVGMEPPTCDSGLWKITLILAQDVFPLHTLSPDSTVEPYDDYSLDNALFTDYGVRVLGGTQASITRTPDAKENLSRDIASLNGLIYGNGKVSLKDYDATLRCLLRAATQEELWRNYMALLRDITSPGPHYISVNSVRKRYPIFYQSSSVNKFYSSGKIWLEFDIEIKVFGKPTKYDNLR
ncbi:MAG: hypothetical protein II288_07585 [Alistipes sp.]|nr:hypothetical protein [Alistipes sp.]